MLKTVHDASVEVLAAFEGGVGRPAHSFRTLHDSRGGPPADHLVVSCDRFLNKPAEDADFYPLVAAIPQRRFGTLPQSACHIPRTARDQPEQDRFETVSIRNPESVTPQRVVVDGRFGMSATTTSQITSATRGLKASMMNTSTRSSFCVAPRIIPGNQRRLVDITYLHALLLDSYKRQL